MSGFSILLPKKGLVAPAGRTPYVFEDEDEANRMAHICYGARVVGGVEVWRIVPAEGASS